MDIEKRAMKSHSHSFRTDYDKSAVRLLENGEQRYREASNKTRTTTIKRKTVNTAGILQYIPNYN